MSRQADVTAFTADWYQHPVIAQHQPRHAQASARAEQRLGCKGRGVEAVSWRVILAANRQQISVAQGGQGQRQRREVIDHPQLLHPQMRAQRSD